MERNEKKASEIEGKKQAVTAAMKPLRIAHVGAGQWSRHAHGPALQRLASQSQVSLELICDLNLDRARQFRDLFHYRLASDNIHQSLGEVQPDAIVCTVQPSATAALVRSLLPLGIPLITEKPPGISLVEATSLAIASAQFRAFTFVAFNRRFIPSMQRLKQWASHHSPSYARAEMLRTNRLEPNFPIETGIHALDAIRYLMGNPDSMDMTSRRHPDSAAVDSFVRLHFANSAVADISLMLNTGLRRESYFLSAPGATAEAALESAYSSGLAFQGDRYWSGEAITAQHSLSDDPLVDGGFLGEYEEFLRLLAAGSPSTCSLADAARSMQLAEAIQNRFTGQLRPLSIE
jgi:predicted dehydrogenase